MADETQKINEFRTTVATCYLAAQMLAQHDLQAVLEGIAKTEAIGPILDPTLWREKAQAMAEDREVIKAALSLAEFGRKYLIKKSGE